MFSPEDKLKAICMVRYEGATLKQAAAAAGAASHASVVNWLSEYNDTFQGLYALAGEGREREGTAMFDIDDLPDDPEELKRIIFDLRFEKDLTEAVIDIVKKDPGADPMKLPNREKAMLVGALKEREPRYSISFLTSSLGLAPASFYYHRKRAGLDRDADIRESVIAACRANPAWGYRRIRRAIGGDGAGRRASEKRVRRVMAQEGLQPSRRRKVSRYSSYSRRADTSRLPNVPLREDGTHDFSADRPNRLWLTDVTEFSLPSGERVYLSPIMDCFDGSLVAWRSGTSERADDLTNPSLEDACRALAPGDRHVGPWHPATGW